MKLTILVLCLCALSYSHAQETVAGTNAGLVRSFAGFPPSQFFQNIVLQTEAQKLLITPDFPEDLQERVVNTMSSAEAGFDNCNAVATLPWMQIRCVVLQLQKAKIDLKVIEDEANLRAEAAAANGNANTATTTV